MVVVDESVVVVVDELVVVVLASVAPLVVDGSEGVSAGALSES